MNAYLKPILAGLAGIILFAGCGESASPEANNASGPAELDAYLLQAEPEGAVSVTEARQSAEPGRPIVVAGQIGAALNPFSADYATFVLGDEALMYCDEMGDDDHCATPWDACCEDPDKVMQGRASVQVLADGNPLPGSLKGVGGLTELDHVVVAGTVDPSSTPQNLIINASGIYRKSE
jgi:hypothetical protein